MIATDLQPQRPDRKGTAWIGLLVIVGLITAGAFYQMIGTRIDLAQHPPQGELIDVGGYRLHLYCTGKGSPTVILLHGLGGSTYHWVLIQPEIARFTTVCSYDRAGYGWSDPGPAPRSQLQNAHELHTLLNNAGIQGPIVLVGHSWGASAAQVYFDQYPDDVQGMVLVDGGDAAVTRTLCPAQRCMPTTARVGADIVIGLQPLFFRLGLVRLFGNPQAYGENLKYLTSEQLAAFNALYGQTKGADTNWAEWSSWEELSVGQVGEPGSLGDLPLFIVRSDSIFPSWAYDGEPERWQEIFAAQQEALVALSSNSTDVVVPGSDHASLLFHPQHRKVVVGIIQTLVADLHNP